MPLTPEMEPTNGLRMFGQINSFEWIALLPIFVTEPAIGEGPGATLIYFHQDDDEAKPNFATSQEIDQIAFRVALETDKNGNEILVWYRSAEAIDERYTTEPNTGFWRPFGVGFLRMLPIGWLL